MKNLEEFITETEALTYVNSLKVTLTELKAEFSSIEEMQEYVTQACERARKLIRKADNQYRVVAKLAQEGSPVASDVTLEDDTEDQIQYEELMKNE